MPSHQHFQPAENQIILCFYVNVDFPEFLKIHFPSSISFQKINKMKDSGPFVEQMMYLKISEFLF